MRSLRTRLVHILVGAMILAACGGTDIASEATSEAAESTSAPAAEVSSVPVTDPPATTSPTSVPVDTEPPATTSTTTTSTTTTSTTTTTALPVNEDRGGAAEKFAAALTDVGQIDSFRVSSYQAQLLKIPGLDVDAGTGIDLSRPATLAELDSDGDFRTTIDIGVLLGALVDDNPETEQVFQTLTVELWADREQIIMDTTRYQGLLDLDPSQDLGLFSPGIFTIDLGLLGDIGGDDMVRLLVGNPSPDMNAIAQGFVNGLKNIAVDPTDPTRFTGTATFSELLEIQGVDAADTAASAAAGVAPAIGLGGQELADLYLDFYASTATNVEVKVGADGGLSQFSYEADLASIFGGLVELLLSGESSIGTPPADAAEELDAVFADVEFSISAVAVFEADTTIDVILPDGDLEDRTLQAIEFFEASGIEI